MTANQAYVPTKADHFTFGLRDEVPLRPVLVSSWRGRRGRRSGRSGRRLPRGHRDPA